MKSKDPNRFVWWCSRETVPTPYYALCLSKRNFRKELKRLDARVAGPWITRGAVATAHDLGPSKGPQGIRHSVLVCFDRKRERLDAAEFGALMAHEAWHVVEAQMETMREKKPSSEFVAYSLQTITGNLIHAYHEMTKLKTVKKGKRAKA